MTVTEVEAPAHSRPRASQSCKLSAETADSALSHALANALETFGNPAPDAVTQFECGAGKWRIEAYFSGWPTLEALSAQLGSILESPLPPLRLESVPDLNWVAISQAALPPVGAGRFTIHGTHDRARVPHGPNAILIDAGEAFGTAHHATTRGCLVAIDRLARRRARPCPLPLQEHEAVRQGCWR